MTKKELIAALRDFGDDAPVFVAHFFNEYAVCEEVSDVRKNGQSIQLDVRSPELRVEEVDGGDHSKRSGGAARSAPQQNKQTDKKEEKQTWKS